MHIAEQIKSVLTVPQVARFYSYEPNRAGFIKCPFHGGGQEHTASCKLYAHWFKCQACPATGTVIDFAMLLFGISFSVACVRLNADFGLGLSSDRPDPRELEKLRRRAREARERQAAEARRQADVEEYWWEIYWLWERLKETKKTGEPFSDEWTTAVKWIDLLGYWLGENNYWWK
jgi:hypothetical protein